MSWRESESRKWNIYAEEEKHWDDEKLLLELIIFNDLLGLWNS